MISFYWLVCLSALSKITQKVVDRPNLNVHETIVRLDFRGNLLSDLDPEM